MYLGGKVEFYRRIVRPFRIQKPLALRQVDQVTILIRRDISVLETGKILQLFRVLAGDPAGLVKRHGVELNGGAVLMQQAVLDDLELKLTHTADDLLLPAILGEKLGDTFVRQLRKPLLQLFGFHRVFIDYLLKNLRRKGRNSGKKEILAFGEGIPNLEVAGIKKTDHIAREGFVDDVLVTGQECIGVAKAYVLVETNVVEVFVAFEPSATDAQEGNTVAVFWVEVGVDLKDKTAELVLFHVEMAGRGLPAQRSGCDPNKGVEHFPNPEVIDGAAKEDGRHLSGEIAFDIQLAMNAVHEFYVLPQSRSIFFAEFVIEQGIIEAVKRQGILVGGLCIGGEQDEVLVVKIVDTLEVLAAVDGPGHGVQGYIQLFFDLFQQVEAVLAVPVHLIDKYNDGGTPHAADFHQPAGLGFYSVDAVDDQDNAVDGSKGTIGIFGKVLVTGGIQQVDEHALVFKAHDGGRYGDTTLAFDLHKVAGCVFLDLVAFYGTGCLDSAAEEQELLRQGCFTRIGVGYDGKGFTLVDLGMISHIGPQRYEFSGAKPRRSTPLKTTPHSQALLHGFPDRRYVIGEP